MILLIFIMCPSSPPLDLVLLLDTKPTSKIQYKPQTNSTQKSYFQTTNEPSHCKTDRLDQALYIP